MRGAKLILIILLAAAQWVAVTGRAAAADTNGANEGFQAVFDQFPLLKPETNAAGELIFQSLKLDKGVPVDGAEYYGFRFQVPPREKQEDFVWAFVVPGKLNSWYIVADKGGMDGFDNFYNGRTRANYEGTEHLFPTSAKPIYLQRLPGDRLEDGRTYLVWFKFNDGRPNRMSLKFTFAKIPQKGSKVAAIEKALGLKLKKR